MTQVIDYTDRVFNDSLPLGGAILEEPTQEDLRDVRSFKYAEYQYAYDNCGSDYVRYVLDNIPIYGDHKRTLIDIKIHDLRVDNVACRPGWHLDGSINPQGLPKKPETLTLFVTGQHALTEFLAEPIVFSVPSDWDFVKMNRKCGKQIPDFFPTMKVRGCQFHTYDDSFFHRGTRATGAERRLLIRTTETDIIPPRNHIYTPYTHPSN